MLRATLGHICLRSSLGHLSENRTVSRLEWFSRIAPVSVELIALFESSSQRAPSGNHVDHFLTLAHSI
jgi:hypothetical protein